MYILALRQALGVRLMCQLLASDIILVIGQNLIIMGPPETSSPRSLRGQKGTIERSETCDEEMRIAVVPVAVALCFCFFVVAVDVVVILDVVIAAVVVLIAVIVSVALLLLLLCSCR